MSYAAFFVTTGPLSPLTISPQPLSHNHYYTSNFIFTILHALTSIIIPATTVTTPQPSPLPQSILSPPSSPVPATSLPSPLSRPTWTKNPTKRKRIGPNIQSSTPTTNLSWIKEQKRDKMVTVFQDGPSLDQGMEVGQTDGQTDEGRGGGVGSLSRPTSVGLRTKT